MLLLYHNLNKFAAFLFIFFIAHQPLTQITENKKDENNLEFFSGNASERWTDRKSSLRADWQTFTKSFHKSRRGRINNKRDERANETLFCPTKGVLIATSQTISLKLRRLALTNS